MAIARVGAAAVQQQPKEFKPNTLDKDAFLNLLVTQLRNQNPLQPMEDKEFISQMAQFTSLEQIQNMNKTMKVDSAYNLVNKLVKASYTDEEKNETKDIAGLVSMVRVDNEKIYIKVNGVEVPFENVKEITDSVSPYDQMQAINQNFKMSSAFSLIGKEIKAKVPDSTGTSYEEISGTAESVRVDKGNIFIQVNGKEVPIETIYFVK